MTKLRTLRWGNYPRLLPSWAQCNQRAPIKERGKQESHRRRFEDAMLWLEDIGRGHEPGNEGRH